MNKSNVAHLPVTHTLVPVNTGNQLHPNREWAREVIAARREREGASGGLSPMPELPTEPANQEDINTIRPVTAERLDVSDGVVFEGGKRELSVRARMQRLGI